MPARKDGFELAIRTKPDAAEIGTALRGLREAAGISIADMAERVGVARQNLSRIELGKKEPMLSTINKYLRTLGFELTLIARPKPPAKKRAPSTAQADEADEDAREGSRA